MNSEVLDRLPPQSLDDERKVLSSFMLKAKCLDEVADILTPEDFYRDANRRLYKAMLELAAARKPFYDISIVREYLKRTGEYEAIGGPDYLAEVHHSCATAAHAIHYAEIVKEKATRREVISAATEMLRSAWDEGADVSEILNDAEFAIHGIQTGSYEDGVTFAQAAAMKFIDRVEDICERKKHLGLPTGFTTFDALTGGLFPGEFCVLAARPSVGKTALAAQISGYSSARGRLVYFVSLEMDDVELIQRDICALSGVNSRLIRTGSLSGKDMQALIDGAEVYSRRAVAIDSRPELKVYDIRRKARALAKDGLALIVVDYIGLITPNDYKAPREQQVARISRELKALAKELNVPVLCLSQLNRAIADDEHPTLANLRESGSIEQDAHMVMFIHRPEAGIWLEEEAYDATGKRKIRTKTRADWDAELILAKNRNGEKTTVKLAWNPAQTMFTDLAQPNRGPDEEF